MRPEWIVPGSGQQTHRAGWLMTEPGTVWENSYVTMAGGRILDLGQGGPKDGGPITDHGPGVLMPGLVNAHTHLELCALQGKVPAKSGFLAWVQALLKTREAVGEKRLLEGVRQGIQDIQDAGTAAIGEIASLGLSKTPFADSDLGGVWFAEYLGGDRAIDLPLSPARSTKRFTLAGHAPHTTGPDLLRRLKRMSAAQRLVFSLHLAESPVESEFIRTGQGAWAKFLTERGIGFCTWPLPAKSAVAYADQLGILDRQTLAVHLLETDTRDFEILSRRGVSVCLCPRSNYFLHQQLPDIPGLLAAGLQPALGTDSLASNTSLSIFDEMAFVGRCFPGISPDAILNMATVYGAKALGLENDYGSLAPGKQGALLFVPLKETRSKSLAEALVFACENRVSD